MQGWHDINSFNTPWCSSDHHIMVHQGKMPFLPRDKKQLAEEPVIGYERCAEKDPIRVTIGKDYLN